MTSGSWRWAAALLGLWGCSVDASTDLNIYASHDSGSREMVSADATDARDTPLPGSDAAPSVKEDAKSEPAPDADGDPRIGDSAVMDSREPDAAPDSAAPDTASDAATEPAIDAAADATTDAGPACDCSDGPCCDGCWFLPAEMICSSVMYWHCYSDSCGPLFTHTRDDTYCTGASPDCTGAVVVNYFEDIWCQSRKWCNQNQPEKSADDALLDGCKFFASCL